MATKQFDRKAARVKRHSRVRVKVEGTPERPRLSIFRSLNHIYAQVIDDSSGRTLASASTLELKAGGSNAAAASAVGKAIAASASKAGVKQVVFDRGGFLYHGRVKALAEAAREAGLEF
jgi:large subunit ribosomal protein L18